MLAAPTRAFLFVIALLTGLSTGATAQSVDSKSSDQALETIVVTANKREQNLNDVGQSVVAISGDKLKELQVSSAADLANIIPGLSYTVTPNGNTVFTLRGIGFYDASLADYPAVSEYADEVPFPFLALAKHALYDLERVEVLQGPQGTLFGENSTGGAINYVQAKPTKDFSAGVDVTYGRFNEFQTESFVSGPLTDNLQIRVTARTEHAEGWQQSNSRPGDTNGAVDNTMGRLQLAFQPSDRARFLLNVNGWHDATQPQAPQVISFVQEDPVASPELAAAKLSPMKPRAADWNAGLPFADNNMYQASLRGDVDIVSDITLTSLTSYADYKQHQGQDGDGLPFFDTDFTPDNGLINTFYEELRLANASSNSIRWVAGSNFERSSVDEVIENHFGQSSTNATLATLGYPASGGHFFSYQKLKDYAFFGNVEADVIDHLTLKGGARYTNAQSETRSCFADLVPSSAIGEFIYDVVYGGAFGPYKPGDCVGLNNQTVTIGGIPPGSPGLFSDFQRQHNISWHAGVDWKAQPGVLVYANIAKGYKAGGFPEVAGSTFTSYLGISQESVLSYEIGTKASMLNNTLQVNASAYYYDYKDKQLRAKVIEPVFGPLDSLVNIPKSKVQGFDLEVITRPIQGLTLSLNFVYADAVVLDYTGVNAAGVPANFAGTQIPYTPKYQGSVNADYHFPITPKLDTFAGVSVNARSSTVAVVGGTLDPPNADPAIPDLFGIAGYSLVDVRAGIGGKDGHWRATLWGKNILNKYYWNNVATVTDVVDRYTGMPATYGVNVNYRW